MLPVDVSASAETSEVLIGCFDDSGTHDKARVVVNAGFAGTNTAWKTLEAKWKNLLDRESISCFHLSECETPDGIFRDWKPARRDMVVHDFRQVILESDLVGIGAAVFRSDWQKHVMGFFHYWLGSEFEWSFGICMNWLLRLGRESFSGMPISAVFDKRPQNEESMAYIASAYPRVPAAQPELQSVHFAEVKSFIPLQAADMLATETYRYLLSGKVARPHFQDMLNRGKLHGTFYDEPMIIELLNGMKDDQAFVAALRAAAAKQGIERPEQTPLDPRIILSPEPASVRRTPSAVPSR